MNSFAKTIIFFMLLSLPSFAGKSFSPWSKDDILKKQTESHLYLDRHLVIENISITDEQISSEVARLIDQNEAIQTISNMAKSKNIIIRFTNESHYDLQSYAYFKILMNQNADLLIKEKFDDHITNIFPHLAKDNVLHFTLQGDSDNITSFKNELHKLLKNVDITPLFHDELRDDININFTDRMLSLNSTINKKELSEKFNSVIHALHWLSRYGVSANQQTLEEMKKIIIDTHSQNITIDEVTRLEAVKIFSNAQDLEDITKLIKTIDPNNLLSQVLGDEFKYYIEKEILVPKSIFTNNGATAKDIGLNYLNHQTKKHSYYAMTTNPFGKANLTISRANHKDELARRGDGFYTMNGADNEFHPDYGKYKIIFKVNPNAREGRDFYRYYNEIIFTNLDALEIDYTMMSTDIEIYDFFKMLSEIGRNQNDDEINRLYRAYYKIQLDSILTTYDRQAIDLLAINVFENMTIFEISEFFVEAYLNLPRINNESSKKAFDSLIKLLEKRIYTESRMKELKLLDILLESQYRNDVKELVTKYHNNPIMNGRFYLNDNIMPFINTKLIHENWFIELLKNSEYKEQFMKILKSGYNNPNIDLLISRIEDGANCFSKMNELL
ncbi:hypothetical protein M899_2308 [Bacteriovorax sp. BSW11_IV]|uniref:hypothetical protein n=1 Tax=Bacteriovorax sp. BSW11_IV TaxID=1353529 RepID=UPI000389F5A8|nr:hypothetical protein [Bacteriovorax sp. BSW11_IV]EQC44506.1 hypothetical protein M899_2308 [Bacteriovorax sp. BSW11_IV]